MTVYVDDLTFSGSKVNNRFMQIVRSVVAKHGQQLNFEKTRLYKVHETKLVTGVVIQGNSLKVRNAHHKSYFADMQIWKTETDPKEQEIVSRRLLSKLAAMGAVDNRFLDKARSVRVKQSRLTAKPECKEYAVKR